MKFGFFTLRKWIRNDSLLDSNMSG